LKKGFDLNLLPTLVALKDRGVALAAHKVGVSQPALGEALGKLRKIAFLQYNR
jgi:DNA-binding transcriptional LysR family regulator